MVGIIVGFARGFGTGLLTLIVGAIAAFLNVLMARIWMELLIVIFRIAENTQEIAQRGRLQR